MSFTGQTVTIGKRLKDKISEDDISGMAAEMAYRFFLAIFPFFIFLAALGGFVASAINVDNPVDEIMNLIGESLPEDTASVLRTQLEGVINNQNGGLLTVGILGTIWASSAAITALMKNLNRIFDVKEDRNMIMKYAISLGLTVLSAGTIVVAFVIFFFGQIYGPELAAEIGLRDEAATAISILRWPAALILLMLAMAFLYWMAPNTKLPIRWISPGAVFFGIVWLVATFLFGLYVANFSSYNATYGALGAVVILLIWFYLTSFIMLLGGAINAVMAEEVGDADLSHDEPSEREGPTEGRTDREAGREREAAGEAPQRDGRPELQPAGVAAFAGQPSSAHDGAQNGGSRPSGNGAGASTRQEPQVLQSRVGVGLTSAVAVLALVRALRAK